MDAQTRAEKIRADMRATGVLLEFFHSEYAQHKSDKQGPGLLEAIEEHEERLNEMQRQLIRLEYPTSAEAQKQIIQKDIFELQSKKSALLSQFDQATRKRNRLAQELEDIDEELNYLYQMM